MNGWTTDPGDLVIALTLMTTFLLMGAGFLQNIVEGFFHVD